MIEYLKKALELFVSDPPDSDYQRGYLAAIIAVAEEQKSPELTQSIGFAKAVFDVA